LNVVIYLKNCYNFSEFSCFFTGRLRIKQRLSLIANPTAVTKLLFINIKKTEVVYIGGQKIDNYVI